MDGIIRLLLRFAVWRWPADIRAAQAREWAAELEAAGREAPNRLAGTMRRLRFVVSLAMSPPLPDEFGAPRGWREFVPGLGSRLRWPAALLALGFATRMSVYAVNAIVGAAAGPDGPEGPANAAITGSTYVLAALAWALAGRRLGRRGSRAAAVTGPVVLSLALAVPHVALLLDNRGAVLPAGDLAGVAVCLATWILLASALAAVVSRPVAPGLRWPRMLTSVLGVPAAAGAAVIAGLLATGRSGQPMGLPIWQTDLMSTGVADSLVYYLGSLTVLGALAVGFASTAPRIGAARPAGATTPARLHRAAAVTGLLGLVTGAVGWAYTVAVLTPDLQRVNELPPAPGSRSELYMWVSELRWAGILLAALGLLLATADRTAAPLAATVLAIALLGADAVAWRLDASGPGALRVLLAVAAAAVAVGWWVAGRPGPTAPVRRRSAVTALVGAYAGPLLLGQGTEVETQRHLPIGLALIMAILPAAFVLVAGAGTLTARTRPVHPVAAGALLVLPAALLAVLGIGTVGGFSIVVTEPAGLAVAGPLLVTTIALLRPHRRRSTARTVAVRAGLVLAAIAAMVAAPVLALALSAFFAANLLFAIAGGSYPADGISLIPGAVLLAIPAAGALATRITNGRPETARQPEPLEWETAYG